MGTPNCFVMLYWTVCARYGEQSYMSDCVVGM